MDRNKVVKKWVDVILSGYPIRPVIEIEEYLIDACGKIVDDVLKSLKGDKSYDKASEGVEELMRFLATDRGLRPSESVKLVKTLEDIILKEYRDVNVERLRDVIEDVIYLSFDAYMSCREKIFELRIKEKERDIEIMRRIIEFSEKASGD